MNLFMILASHFTSLELVGKCCAVLSHSVVSDAL